MPKATPGAAQSARLAGFTGRSRGFAFVEMASDEDAQKAITQLNSYQLEGRALTVNEARPKTAGGGGGFDGGNSRRRSEPRW